jgi:chromosome segregation ATPase
MAKTRQETKTMVTELQQVLSQLKTAEDEGKRSTASLKQAEKELEARDAHIRELENNLKKAEATIAPTNDQLTALLEENRRLAADFDQVTKEVNQVRELGIGLRRELEATIAEAKSATEARQDLVNRLQTLDRERTNLQARLDLASQQLTSQGKIPILPASEVAKLTGDLVAQIQGGFEGLRVRDGELKLKIALAGIDKKTGFVVPTIDSDPKTKESLQELTIRFDKNKAAE